MKTNLTIHDLDRKVTAPTLAGIDALLSKAKTTVPADSFPELKLSKTYRFTANVMREYGLTAFEKLDNSPCPFASDEAVILMDAYSDLHAMLESDTYIVNETYATLLRSVLYKLRNAVKAIASK